MVWKIINLNSYYTSLAHYAFYVHDVYNICYLKYNVGIASKVLIYNFTWTNSKIDQNSKNLL